MLEKTKTKTVGEEEEEKEEKDCLDRQKAGTTRLTDTREYQNE